MRARLDSFASSTSKHLRYYIGDPTPVERPARYELLWGVGTRGAALPLAVAAFVSAAVDWTYASDKEWTNTVITVGAIASFVLNWFLFINIMFGVPIEDIKSESRRFTDGNFALVDIAAVALLVTGGTARAMHEDWTETPTNGPSSPGNRTMIVFSFCLLLAFLHSISGLIMCIAALRNWVHLRQLSPDEYRDYRQGQRPLDPPPAYELSHRRL